jgi:hypothetical protein
VYGRLELKIKPKAVEPPPPAADAGEPGNATATPEATTEKVTAVKDEQQPLKILPDLQPLC